MQLIRFSDYPSLLSQLSIEHLTVQKCVHAVAPAYLSDLYVSAILPSQVVSICDLQRLALYWCRAPGLQLDNEVSQSTDQPHGTVCHQHYGERLQAVTEDAPVFDRPAPLRSS